MTVVSELRRLLAEATSGPWRAEIDGYDTLYVAGERKLLPGQGRRFQGVAEGPLLDRAGRHWWEQDAALIVALRNHADALLDVVEAAREFLAAEDEWDYRDLNHDIRQQRKPDRQMMDDANDELRDSLTRLDGKETP